MDDYSHYLFTPRDLTQWAMSLLRYDLTSGARENTSDTVLEIWAYEARRLFRDRIVGPENQAKVDKLLMSVVRSDWSANIFDDIDCEYLVVAVFITLTDSVTIMLMLCAEGHCCHNVCTLDMFLKTAAVGEMTNQSNLFRCSKVCLDQTHC